MGEFAPMHCKYCGAGPYSGVTLGDRHDDPHDRTRWYDCDTRLAYDELSHIAWQPSERCANALLGRVHALARKWADEHEENVDRIEYYFDKGGDTDEAEDIGHWVTCADHAQELLEAIAGKAADGGEHG